MFQLPYFRQLRPRISRSSWVSRTQHAEPLRARENYTDEFADRADTQEAYDSEKAALLSDLTSEYAPYVYALTIGSESLYRGVSAEELLPRIKDAKTTFGKLVPRIGTVDSWNKFADGAADAILTSGVPTFLYVLSTRH